MSGVALFVIVFLICGLAAVIVALGSLPGKIALKRGHPWPEAVNVASWVGLATGVFWPIAFIWAYLPVPASGGGAATGGAGSTADLNGLQAKLASLEGTVAKLQSQSEGGAGSTADLNSLQAKLASLEGTVAKLQSQSEGGAA
jgi:hypothetical protein